MLYCICVYTYKDICTKYIYIYMHTIEYIHVSPCAARSVEVTQKFISLGLEKWWDWKIIFIPFEIFRGHLWNFWGGLCSLPCLLQFRLGDIRDFGCNCDRQTREYNTFQRRAGDVDPFVWEDFPPKVCGCVCVCMCVPYLLLVVSVPFDVKHLLQNSHKSTASAKSLRFLGRRCLGRGCDLLLKYFHVKMLKSADTCCENKIPIMQLINTQLNNLLQPRCGHFLYLFGRLCIQIQGHRFRFWRLNLFLTFVRIGSQSAQRVEAWKIIPIAIKWLSSIS